MAKATWQGHEIYMIDCYKNGWAKIAFINPASFFTGTGAYWVSMDDIIVEGVE